jgi:hypothetical protein
MLILEIFRFSSFFMYFGFFQNFDKVFGIAQKSFVAQTKNLGNKT